MFASHLRIFKWIIPGIKLSFITCLIICGYAASAQLQGQLPVNLKTFAARAENSKQVKVFWTTEYEKDNAFFNIERSPDGINYAVVGTVAGKNLHGHLTDYVFYDPAPMNGISFYRLKQVDVDGKFSYSPIERINNSDAANVFDIYPNPAPANRFKIDLLQTVAGRIDMMVFDMNGRLLLQQQYQNSNIITVDHSLTAGIYTVKISGKDFRSSEKLVIQ